jgi:hypothetical protein
MAKVSRIQALFKVELGLRKIGEPNQINVEQRVEKHSSRRRAE